ncbi:sensor histidine kinase [Deinococcus peraridilitoris]|nr:ATP-binding protein [Deinococcus peraridilitoris]
MRGASKLEARKGKRRRTWTVDVDEAVVLAVLRSEVSVAQAARRRGVSERLPVVKGDPLLWCQSFENLLSNAVKYTSKREIACIGIQAEVKGESVVFSVTDNGAGFDPRFQKRLFDVFQRLHRKDQFRGAGVGLATVRRMVERHHGRIWAEGRLGERATFYLQLPR